MTPAAATAAPSTTNTHRRPTRRRQRVAQAEPGEQRADADDGAHRPRARATRSRAPPSLLVRCLLVSTFGGSYSAPCLIRIRSDSNGALRVELAQRPSHTTGAPSLNRSGGSPAWCDRHRVLAVGDLEAHAACASRAIDAAARPRRRGGSATCPRRRGCAPPRRRCGSRRRSPTARRRARRSRPPRRRSRRSRRCSDRAACGARLGRRAPRRRRDRRHSLAVGRPLRALRALHDPEPVRTEHDAGEHPAGDDVLGEVHRGAPTSTGGAGGAGGATRSAIACSQLRAPRGPPRAPASRYRRSSRYT